MSKPENKGLPKPGALKESFMNSFNKQVEEVEQSAPEQVEVEKPVEKPAGPLKVMAIYNGFYRGSRIKAGDVFTIASQKDLGKWMKKI